MTRTLVSSFQWTQSFRLAAFAMFFARSAWNIASASFDTLICRETDQVDEGAYRVGNQRSLAPMGLSMSFKRCTTIRWWTQKDTTITSTITERPQDDSHVLLFPAREASSCSKKSDSARSSKPDHMILQSRAMVKSKRLFLN